MKIAFDGGPLCDRELTGIGYYQEGLTKSLMKNKSEDNFVFNCFSFLEPEYVEKRFKKLLPSNAKRKKVRYMKSGLYRMIWGLFPIPYRMFFGKNDVTHFCNYLIPPFVGGKKVCTIHDLAFKVYPETVRRRTRAVLNSRLKSTIKRADHIVVDSQFTKNELLRFYKVDEDKVSVVYCGVDFDTFAPMELDNKCSSVLEKYSLRDGEYFLYLGTIEPRKNISAMIGAYAEYVKRARQEKCNVYPFILAGKLGWYYDEILERVKILGVENLVRFIGYVDKEDMPYLYSRATAFVFVSLYEGFGIPVAEAMACGTAVLASDSSSIPEITGECAILCNPLSEREIADGMCKYATDGEFRKDIAQRGMKRVQRFTWDESAQKMSDIYVKITK